MSAVSEISFGFHALLGHVLRLLHPRDAVSVGFVVLVLVGVILGLGLFDGSQQPGGSSPRKVRFVSTISYCLARTSGCCRLRGSYCVLDAF